MNIESLEINLLKASEIKDGDIIVVKIDEDQKSKMTKDLVETLYKKIIDMIKKENISVYFFPKNISIEIIKNNIQNIEGNKEKIENSIQ